MRSTTVAGRFLNKDGTAVQDRVRFVPSRFWVKEGDVDYATLCPEPVLDEGRFSVELTPTFGLEDVDWHYSAVCPGEMGSWTIRIPATADTLLLRDLLPAKFRA